MQSLRSVTPTAVSTPPAPGPPVATRDSVQTGTAADLQTVSLLPDVTMTCHGTVSPPQVARISQVLQRMLNLGATFQAPIDQDGVAALRQGSFDHGTLDLNLAAPGYRPEIGFGVLYPAVPHPTIETWERLADLVAAPPAALQHQRLSYTADKNRFDAYDNREAIYPLDAATAALRLEQGLPVTLESPDGRSTELHSMADAAAPHFASPAAPQALQLGQALDTLEKQGFADHQPKTEACARAEWQNWTVRRPPTRHDMMARLLSGGAWEFNRDGQFYSWTAADVPHVLDGSLPPQPRDRYLVKDHQFLNNVTRADAQQRLQQGQEVYYLAGDGRVANLHQPADLATPFHAFEPAPAGSNLLISAVDTFFNAGPEVDAEYTPHLFDEMEPVPGHLAIETVRNAEPDGPLYREEVGVNARQLLDKPAGLFNDPAVLSKVVFDALSRHPEAPHTSVYLASHGGGEHGMLPDHRRTQGFSTMTIDELAGALHDGLSRYNQAHGTQRRLDVLVLDSCLMGNVALLDALSRQGDIGVVVASPPVVYTEQEIETPLRRLMADPATASLGPEDVGRRLVEQAPSEQAFGAYRCDAAHMAAFRQAWDGFCQAAVAHPELRGALKKMVADNRERHDYNGCDAIELAQSAAGLAPLQAASQHLEQATRALVLARHQPGPRSTYQRATLQGPFVYLPDDDYDRRAMETPLGQALPSYQALAHVLAGE